jgi:hypothetical protein
MFVYYINIISYTCIIRVRGGIICITTRRATGPANGSRFRSSTSRPRQSRHCSMMALFVFGAAKSDGRGAAADGAVGAGKNRIGG